MPHTLPALLCSSLGVWVILLFAAVTPSPAAPAAQASSAQAPGGIAEVFFQPPSMSLSTFRFRCIMFSDRGRRRSMFHLSIGCGMGTSSDICDHFQYGLEDMHESGEVSRPLCLQACRNQRRSLGQGGVFGCSTATRNAWRTCNQYCRSNFP